MKEPSGEMILGACAAAAAVAAWALKSSGAWGLSATWILWAIAVWMWTRASGLDAQVKHTFEQASQAYIAGMSVPQNQADVQGFKQGFLWTLSALFFGFLGLIGILGTCSVGFSWGMLATLPVAILFRRGYKKVEADAEK